MRMPDALIMGMLQNGTAYFGSASLLGIGAGFTLLSASDSLPPILGYTGPALEGRIYDADVLRPLSFNSPGPIVCLITTPLPSARFHKQIWKVMKAIAALNCAKALNVWQGSILTRPFACSFCHTAHFLAYQPWALMGTTFGLTIIMLRRQFLTNTHLQGLSLAWSLKKDGD